MADEIGPIDVDGIIVINLDRRPDRWTAFQAAWRGHLEVDRLYRLAAVDGRALPGAFSPPWFRGRKRDATWVGRAGCALSHAKAWRLARDRGWARTLVLEDDAVPVGPDPLAVLRRADRGWNLLYLGCGDPEGAQGEAADGVTPIGGALDLHAYLIDAQGRDRLLRGGPETERIWPWIARERAVDRWIARKAGHSLTVGCVWPPQVVQTADTSDICQRPTGAAPVVADLPRSRTPKWRGRAFSVVLDLGDRLRAGGKALVGY